MLPRQNRLAKDKEIKKVLSRGRAFFNPVFNLRFYKNLQATKFTVVVSTKVYKQAVKRNRLKRLIRETIRRKLSQLPTGDYVLMCKPLCAKTEESELLKALNLLINKV